MSAETRAPDPADPNAPGDSNERKFEVIGEAASRTASEPMRSTPSPEETALFRAEKTRDNFHKLFIIGLWSIGVMVIGERLEIPLERFLVQRP